MSLIFHAFTRNYIVIFSYFLLLTVSLNTSGCTAICYVILLPDLQELIFVGVYYLFLPI